ncbi:MAG: cytochrome c maturation protein CcmE [Acidimicrobiia bacterium]
MSHRRFVLFGIGGVVALVVALTAISLDDNLTYYLYPTEAIAQRADFADGARFRLAGTVVPGSIEEDGTSIQFEVTDGGATIPVILSGAPPPLFDENVPVLLEGAWAGEVFNSDLALIRHDENYEAPAEGGAYPEP